MDLEERATTLEAEFVSTPDDVHYQAWQGALRGLSAARQEITDRALLYSAQRVFEFRGKNGKGLAWLARGPTPSTPIGFIRDSCSQLLTAPSNIKHTIPGIF